MTRLGNFSFVSIHIFVVKWTNFFSHSFDSYHCWVSWLGHYSFGCCLCFTSMSLLAFVRDFCRFLHRTAMFLGNEFTGCFGRRGRGSKKGLPKGSAVHLYVLFTFVCQAHCSTWVLCDYRGAAVHFVQCSQWNILTSR